MPDDGSAIFVRSISTETRRPRPAWLASLAIHGMLVAALLRGRSPVLVAPSSVVGGANGASMTHLYWATGPDPEAESRTSLKTSQDRATSAAQLTWKKSQEIDLASNRVPPSPGATESRETASVASNPAPPAGSAHGSSSEGASEGHEIRAALPAVTFEPLVGAEDLRGGVEGNVVIEITIDASGNIVNKVVVQSLGPAIDAKVLAALENWRFRPATRDGVPIPSKQDVVYHFKARSL
ncbi:MAG TPA: TonB family protein [Terriglobales bacterium]|nr:TonB family protein [Terriglobales bacterium]